MWRVRWFSSTSGARFRWPRMTLPSQATTIPEWPRAGRSTYTENAPRLSIALGRSRTPLRRRIIVRNPRRRSSGSRYLGCSAIGPMRSGFCTSGSPSVWVVPDVLPTLPPEVGGCQVVRSGDLCGVGLGRRGLRETAADAHHLGGVGPVHPARGRTPAAVRLLCPLVRQVHVWALLAVAPALAGAGGALVGLASALHALGLAACQGVTRDVSGQGVQVVLGAAPAGVCGHLGLGERALNRAGQLRLGTGHGRPASGGRRGDAEASVGELVHADRDRADLVAGVCRASDRAGDVRHVGYLRVAVLRWMPCPAAVYERVGMLPVGLSILGVDMVESLVRSEERRVGKECRARRS